MSNLIYSGILLVIICLLLLCVLCNSNSIEKYENNNVTDFSQIPSNYLKIWLRDGENEQEKRQKVFNYFSNFLSLYCNVKKEDLQAKTNLFIVKLYNFNKNKSESNSDMYETIIDVPMEHRSMVSGKLKGSKGKYIPGVDIFVFIIFSSKLPENYKKDIICSIILINAPAEIYNPVNNTVDMTLDSMPSGDFEKKIYPLNEFLDIFYNSVIINFFKMIKVIDQDILNYNICE